MIEIDDLTDRWEQMRSQGVDMSPEELCDDPALLEELRRQIHILRSFHVHFGCDDVVRPSNLSNRHQDYCPPQRLGMSGRFLIEASHAMGGIGQVYIAYDEVLGRRVAIKFPRRQGMTAKQIERFELEAKITGQLEHPGIVPVHGLDATETGEPCYVMRFVEGQTLGEAVQHRLGSTGQPDFEYWESDDFRKLLQSVIQVANTVAYAHGHGYLHRDIKPQNILIGPFGETLLLDWGIAKKLSHGDRAASDPENDHAPEIDKFDPSGLTEPGRVLGTPAFASPEQMLETTPTLTPASDVYSLGMTLYFVICGQTPLDALGWKEYWERLQSGIFDVANMLPTNVPRGLRAIVAHATRVDATTRYSNPLMLAADLDRYLAKEQLSVLPESWWSRLGRSLRKHPARAGSAITGIAVCVVAALLVAGVVSLKNQQLTLSNNQLTEALSSVQDANAVAMQALRSMVNESVSSRMAKHDELSVEDRAYIDSILKQYAVIAALKHDLEETKALRAEALGQVGSLYYHLNQPSEAQQNLQQSLALYEELLADAPSDMLRDQYLGFVEVQAALLTESSSYDSVESLTTNAIEILSSQTYTQNQLSTESGLTLKTPSEEWQSSWSSLFMMRANARMKRNEVDLAGEDIRYSVALLEQALAARPDDVSLKFQIGSHMRTFGSLLNEHAEFQRQREQALRMSDRSLELLNAAVALRPESRHYVSSLAWAYCDRSYIYEALGQARQALVDMDQACKWTRQIADEYPVIVDYRKRVVPMLRRRATLSLSLADYESAFRDVQIMAKSELTSVQRDQCIELLQEIDMHWDLAARQTPTPRELSQTLNASK